MYCLHRDASVSGLRCIMKKQSTWSIIVCHKGTGNGVHLDRTALANARTPSISRERPTFADRPGNAPGAPTLLPALEPAWERCAGRRTPAETRSRPLSVAALASLPSDRSSRVRIAGHLHRAVAATLPARSESRCVGFPSLDRCAVW